MKSLIPVVVGVYLSFIMHTTQILQKRFTDFVHNTMASEERVTHACQMADTLIAATHTGGKIVS